MSLYEPADQTLFATADALADDLRELAARHGLDAASLPAELAMMLNSLVAVPNTTFDTPPVYTREDLADRPLTPWRAPAQRSHDFLKVLSARESRRDFATERVRLEVLLSLLWWTAGVRATGIAYDYRDAPLRMIPSAGGLASVDLYVVAHRVDGLAPGAYYVDSAHGLRLLAEGHMIHRLAGSTPGQEWVAESAALLVFVANPARVAHKYGAMGFKLMLLDTGVAVGHAELVTNAHELRATILGGLPASDLEELLHLERGAHVPLATLAIGSRPGHA